MVEEEPRQSPNGGTESKADSLDERLRAARNAEIAREHGTAGKPQSGYRQGSRVLTELIAGPAGGALLGWLFDRWLGTSPWLLLVMLFAGIAVAFRNIYRISNERPE